MYPSQGHACSTPRGSMTFPLLPTRQSARTPQSWGKGNQGRLQPNAMDERMSQQVRGDPWPWICRQGLLPVLFSTMMTGQEPTPSACSHRGRRMRALPVRLRRGNGRQTAAWLMISSIAGKGKFSEGPECLTLSVGLGTVQQDELLLVQSDISATGPAYKALRYKIEVLLDT